MGHMISCRPPTAKVQVQSQVISCGHVVDSVTRGRFSLRVSLLSPSDIIPAMIQTRSQGLSPPLHNLNTSSVAKKVTSFAPTFFVVKPKIKHKIQVVSFLFFSHLLETTLRFYLYYLRFITKWHFVTVCLRLSNSAGSQRQPYSL